MADTTKFDLKTGDGYLKPDEQVSQWSAESRAFPTQRSESKTEETTSRPPKSSTVPATVGGRDEFTGALQPLQVKIPADLIQSLKLHAIGTGRTMSDLVLDCLTSDQQITKAWVSSRRAS